MTIDAVLHAALGSAAALVAAAAVAAGLRDAAARHLAWASGVGGALLVPVFSPLPDLVSVAAVLPPPERALPALAIVWGVGAATVLAAVARELAALRSETRRGRPLRAGRRARLLGEAAGEIGLKRLPRLVEGAEAGAPRTWGLLWPVLLVPPESAQWPDARLRIVLLHELHHLRRGDWAIQLASSLACSLYWFDPLAWVAADRLRRERERACDEAVVRAAVPPAEYAAALLDLARELAPRRTLALMLEPRRSRLERRIRGIVEGRNTRPPRPAEAAVIVAAALATVCVWGVLGVGVGVSVGQAGETFGRVGSPARMESLQNPDTACDASRSAADRLLASLDAWDDPAQRPALLESVSRMRASRDQRRVFEAVLARESLGDRDRAAVLRAAGMIDRSAELAGLLSKFAHSEPLRGEVRAAYLQAALRIDTDRDRAHALAALRTDPGRT